MLKKTVTYKNLNGEEKTETLYFHLKESDLVEMEIEAGTGGSLQADMQRALENEDRAYLIKVIRLFVLYGYGIPTDDGEHIKSPAMREKFASSLAFDKFYMDLLKNEDQMMGFWSAIMPAEYQEAIAAEMAKITTDQPQSEPVKPQFLTRAQVEEMDGDELRSGLATGRYKILPS